MNKLLVVVDDSQIVRKILEVCLGREGFEVMSFEEGKAAMHWMVQTQRIPALILLDLCLPNMDGFEVARRINAQPAFRDTLIVTLSRRDGLLDLLKARLAGAAVALSKPFKPQEVVAVVLSLLAQPLPAHL